MASREKETVRSQFVAEAQKLAAAKGVRIRDLLTKPDTEAKSLLSRASEAGATHAIEAAASQS